MRIKSTVHGLILLMSAGASLCAAQEFSADVVYVASGKQRGASGIPETSSHNPSRIYVSNDNLRLETHGEAGAVLVVNGKENSAYALFPTKKEYEPLEGRPTEYFRVTDAENACAEWERVAAQKIDCEKAGPEAVNGRRAVKYLNKGATDSAVAAVWIDVELKFVVKWESAGSGVELHNIEEGEQAVARFVLPGDYELSKPKKGIKKGFSGR